MEKASFSYELSDGKDQGNSEVQKEAVNQNLMLIQNFSYPSGDPNSHSDLNVGWSAMACKPAKIKITVFRVWFLGSYIK